MPRALLVLIALLVLVMPSSGAFDLQEVVPTWESHQMPRESFIEFFDDMESGVNGWTTFDNTAAPPKFHSDTYMAYDTHSWWCGTTDYDDDGGYGNSWDQRLNLPQQGVGTVTVFALTFDYRYDSEAGYDYTYLQARMDGILTWSTLNGSGWSGKSGGWLSTAATSYIMGAGATCDLRFRFLSDGGWSDEDGQYLSTGGAFMVDNIRVYDHYSGATLFYDDVETGGLCTPAGPPTAGDYWHIIDRKCPAYSDPHSWWCGSFTDTSYVPPNLNNSLTSPLVSLPSDMTAGYFFFRSHWAIPTIDDDFVTVEFSLDGGSFWHSLGNWWGDFERCSGWGVTGISGIDLAPYLNPPGDEFRFRLTMHTTDNGCGPGAGGDAGVMLDDFMLVRTDDAPETWYVPVDFPTIQEAVDRAVPGDVIEVGDGVYTESIVIAKPGITLQAAPGSQPIIDLGKTEPSELSVGSCIRIGATAHGAVIDGFTLTGGDNGITIGGVSGGCTVTNCDIYENYGNGSADWDHGIGIYCSSDDLGTLLVSGNDIHDNSEMGLLLRGHDHVISDNQIHDNGGGVDSYRSIGVTVSYGNSMTFTGNEVYGHAVSGGSGFYVLETVAFEGHTYLNNNIHDNDHNMKFQGSPALPSSVEWNAFWNNPSGMSNTTSGRLVVDARYNWWGDASGPDAATRGTGDPVSTGILYDPWIGTTGGENITCDPDPLVLSGGTPSGFISVDYAGGGTAPIKGYSLKFSWDGGVASTAPVSVTEGDFSSGVASFFDVRVTGTNQLTVDCSVLDGAGVTGGGTLFTVGFTGEVVDYSTCALTLFDLDFRDVSNDPVAGIYDDDGEIIVDRVAPILMDVEIVNSTLGHTDDYIKNGDTAVVTATVSDGDPTFSASDIVAGLLGFGGGVAVNPNPYAGGVATWTLTGVTCSPSDGTVTVTVNAADPLGNAATPDSDDITSDNIAPTKITGFDASPAHEEAALIWDNPSGLDSHLYGVVVRYDAWGDYPLYATSAPAYPGSHTAGDGEAFDSLGAVTGGTHTESARDIYYYTAFAYDWALNYGPADATAQDRATNYWLGDVVNVASSWLPDGLVTVADIDQLAGTYAVVDPAGNDAECNVGPTDDHSRVGIPLPHDGGTAIVNFEDLMIFSMNYGVVSPRVVPLLGGPCEGELALSIEEAERTETAVELVLVLSGNAGELKGTSVTLTCEGLEFSGARLSEEMSSLAADVFFWHGVGEGVVTADLAILGTGVTIGGSGELARFTFTPVAEDYSVGFADAKLRGAGNDDLTAELEGLESGDELPTVFRLVQNSPNPFNPVTTIAFHVPHESQVAVRVYDVSGRVVRTLVDSVKEPGRHSAVWDGRNEHGEECGSGVYFCVMETPEYRGSHKMMLLK